MDTSPAATTVVVDPRHVSYTHVMYALHAFAVLLGIATSAWIVEKFLVGVPSIIAVVMNYARRREVSGTWLASHFRWQLRTFWISAVLVICLWPLVFIPFLWGLYGVLGIWIAYRIVRGWLALRDGRSLPSGGI